MNYCFRKSYLSSLFILNLFFCYNFIVLAIRTHFYKLVEFGQLYHFRSKLQLQLYVYMYTIYMFFPQMKGNFLRARMLYTLFATEGLMYKDNTYTFRTFRISQRLYKKLSRYYSLWYLTVCASHGKEHDIARVE